MQGKPIESDPADAEEEELEQSVQNLPDLLAEEQMGMAAANVEARTVLMESIKQVDEKPLWPEPLVENFEALTLDKISWPVFSDGSAECWKWMLEHKKLVMRCITWNLCGKPPPRKEDIQKLLLPLNKYVQ